MMFFGCTPCNNAGYSKLLHETRPKLIRRWDYWWSYFRTWFISRTRTFTLSTVEYMCLLCCCSLGCCCGPLNAGRPGDQSRWHREGMGRYCILKGIFGVNRTWPNLRAFDGRLLRNMRTASDFAGTNST